VISTKLHVIAKYFESESGLRSFDILLTSSCLTIWDYFLKYVFVIG